MTSKDKTGDQLVASIRKSKSGTVARKTATRSNAGKPAAADIARATETAAVPMKKPSRQGGSYSFGRRVWPD